MTNTARAANIRDLTASIESAETEAERADHDGRREEARRICEDIVDLRARRDELTAL